MWDAFALAIKLSLTQPMLSHFCPSNSLPPSHCRIGRVSNQLCGAQLPTRVNTQQEEKGRNMQQATDGRYIEWRIASITAMQE